MSTKTVLFPPPVRGSTLSDSEQKWLFTIQNLLPLFVVDTSAGPVVQNLPAAGLNNSTGQSNQNAEYTYLKKSADANAVTINGAVGGPYMLVAQNEFRRFKSDGTNWWPIS